MSTSSQACETPRAVTGKRERLLYRCMRTVRELGLKKSTMDDFALHAGVSRITLYREFGSREKLVRAIIAQRSLTFNRRFMALLADVPDVSLKVEAFLVCSAQFARRNSISRAYMSGPIDFTLAGSELQRISRDTWEPVFAHAKRVGSLSVDIDIDAVAEWILMMQTFLCRLANDSPVSTEHLRGLVRTFIVPAFAGPTQAPRPSVLPLTR